MSDEAQLNKVSMVRFERRLPLPIERVWQFLTDTARLPEWFGHGSIEPGLGGAVSLMGGHIRGVITQWNPPWQLGYTWNVFDVGGEQSHYPQSYLCFELQPREDTVLLVLTHLPVLERFEKQTAMGWHSFVDMLGAAVRGEPVLPREVHMKRNAPRYGVDLANLAR
ncbi:MAG TPA: SRPBCC family protein [Xanthobacteraceae bacterium]|nr:SRPBCC family protein [Xanthobacteraceae bacterium]